MASRGRGRIRNPEERRPAPPSKYLWVGNLATDMTEEILASHFSRFGELERVSLQPGRSFAFVDFKYEESAFAAIRALQGFLLAGSPIVVEFTKDNKFSSQPANMEIHKPVYKTTEDLPPSETLWVGYPPHLEIDEETLSKTFSQFGALRKVTTFSDRTYAFVCFENLSAASRAKVALEGKLFGNPRVQIRFAKSETGSMHSKNIGLSPSLEHRNPRSLASYNDFQDSSVPFHGVKKQKMGSFPPEDELPEYPLATPIKLKEWAWEGVIAKGGKVVCRARCFPKGKPMDMMLPGYIDITARTSTEMLSKHYDQARSSWVVFFVPQSDDDIQSYNDFMHYLEEKQRVAVAKINDSTTLFLVAPSEFSEKVLKVPGKLSISGVVLKLEPQISNPTLEPTNSIRDTNYVSRVQFPIPRTVQESSFHNYSPANANVSEQPWVSSSGPLSTLQPEQISMLASSVLGKRVAGHSDNAYGVQNSQAIPGFSFSSSERPYVSQNMHVTTLSSGQLSQLVSRMGGNSSSQTGPQQQDSSTGQTQDADDQRKYQVTLQLAASLLQSVKQAGGN